jgi:hypothetical protein
MGTRCWTVAKFMVADYDGLKYIAERARVGPFLL